MEEGCQEVKRKAIVEETTRVVQESLALPDVLRPGKGGRGYWVHMTSSPPFVILLILFFGRSPCFIALGSSLFFSPSSYSPPTKQAHCFAIFRIVKDQPRPGEGF